MAVPTTMAELSVTDSSNSPAGTEAPSNADDFLRAIQAIVRTTNAKGNDIASATTTDIGAATAEFVDVTGTTTITGLGTIAAGIKRAVRFTGALTLTHNATSLILPSSANITTANGDVALFRSLGSGNWKCFGYIRQDGTPLAIGNNSVTTAKIADDAVTQAKLADGLAGTGPAFSVYASVTQSIASATSTLVVLGAESYDTNSNFASNRFTPTVSGYYLITGSVRGNATNLTSVAAYIYVNGALYRQGSTFQVAAINSTQTVSVSEVIYLNGSTDYVELYGLVSGTSPQFNTSSSAQTSYMSGVLVRAA